MPASLMIPWVMSFVVLRSQVAFARPKQRLECETQAVHAIMSVPDLTVESLLEDLSRVDGQLGTLKRDSYRFYDQELNQRVARCQVELARFFDELGSLDDEDRAAQALLASGIRELKSEINEIHQSIFSRANEKIAPMNTQMQNLHHISSVRDFSELRPNLTYEVPGGASGTRSIMFTERALKEIANSNIEERALSDFLHALQNGIVLPETRKGIKLMKTFEKIPFAEVKLVGVSDGQARLYGCIEDNVIVFQFLGKHMNNSSDPQRERIKSICR